VNQSDDTRTLPPPPRGRAKVVRDAFRLLLRRTAARVQAGVRSPATLAMQQQHVRYLLERLPGATPLEQLTPRRIARVLELEGRGRRRRLCGNSLRKRASTLSQALKLARGRAPRLPEIPYRYEPQRDHLVDVDSYRRLRDALPAHRRLWFVVATWTGQRASDVERMRREDLDVDGRWVMIRSTKTRRPARRFHAAPELVAELGEHWRALTPGAKLVAPWPHACTQLPRTAVRMGLPPISPQRLRHTFFTWFVAANGFTPELLELGGWKDLTIPALVYAHAAPIRLRQQIERTHRLVVRRHRWPKISCAAIPLHKEMAPPVLPAPTGPEPAHADHAFYREQEGIADRFFTGDLVGPAGFEPAARGLKVPLPDANARSAVGNHGDRPCEKRKGRAAAERG